MKAKAITGKSIEEMVLALKDCMADGFKPTLAIVFVSIKQDRKAIVNLLDDAGISIFGITTNGEFIDKEPQKESAAILLLDINKGYFQIYFEEYPDKDYRQVAKGIAHKANSNYDKSAFLIGISHPETDGEEILRGLEEIVGKDVNAFGGAAGDDYSFTETFVFTNGQESNIGMVCIALDEEKVEVNGIATCGWKAVGTDKTVTKSEGNHVYTI